MVTSAHVIFISNPYEPLRDSRTVEVKFTKRGALAGLPLRTWLKQNKIAEFTRPTVCLVNGTPLLRKQWGRRIRPGDTVNFVTCVGSDPITWLWIAYVALVGVSVALALSVKLPSNLTGDTPAADPVYTLKGQRNQIRLGEPIEVPFGRCRLWPSVAAQPFNQYVANQQWLFQLLNLGQGIFTVHDINIEDTPIADFQDVEWEIIPPGSPVTLFPTNVLTVAEVAGIELIGTNEGAGGVYVVDSEGDPDAVPPIPETGHYTAALSGPFVVNPTLTQTDRLEVDIQLPRGLYKQNTDGTLGNLTVSALFEVQEIDNAGTPLGSWVTLQNWTMTLNTITPQRFTLSADVTLGRYRIRASRTNTKDTSASAGDVLIWEAVRAFLPGDTIDNGITRLAVKARASNNLNDSSASRINVVATRHLPVWNGTSWTTQATRSPVWAFCDAFRASYGARLPDEFLDLDALLTLALAAEDREEFFDWVFEQKTTVWDVARTIAATIRAVPMLNGSRVTMVRDDVKTFPVAVFNQENIKKDSFGWEIKLAELQPYDGLRIVYTNPDTWKEESVLCCLPDETGENAETRKILGITSRVHAYRLGMYLRSLDRYVREKFTWETGLEGHIPSFWDMVAVSHDVPRWGTESGGIVLEMSKIDLSPALPGWFQYVFKLSEPFATFTAGTRALLLRNKTSAAIGYFTIGHAGGDLVFYNQLGANAELDALVFDDRKERPLYIFGTPEEQGKNLVLTNLAGNKDGEVTLEARPYDSRLFDYDEATPPAGTDANGDLPAKNSLPAVSGLRVTPAPVDEIDGGLFVAASWFPMPGAQRYLVEFSYDAKAWQEVTETQDVKASFAVTARYLYVRVAAINTGQGAWAYWTGNAPVTDTSVAAVPSALVATSSGFAVIQPDGTALPRVKLTWTAPADNLVKASGRIRIQYKLTVDSDWSDWGTVQGSQLFDFVTDVKAGSAYNFRIRSENKFGGESAWVTPGAGAHTVAGDTTVSAAVPNTVSAQAFKGYIEIAWQKSTSPQVNEYKIYRHTANVFGSAVKIGETAGLWFDDSGFVGGLAAGTLFYYWVVPVSGSDVDGSVHATPATATALAGPLGSALPSDPSAPTMNGGGTYDGSAGGVTAYAVVRIQALPANAVWQNILFRVNGGTSDWQIYAGGLKNAVANHDVRIDDLTPGVKYDVAVQAWAGSGGSNIVTLAGTYFTAATKSAGPSAPTSVTYTAGDASDFARPARFQGANTILYLCRANWTAPANKDVVRYEWALTGTGEDTDAAADAAAKFTVKDTEAIVSFPSPTTFYFRVRAINSTGIASAWAGGGVNLSSSHLRLPAGNLTLQNSNGVEVTAIKTGGSGARQILARYSESVVFTLAGGGPSEVFAVSITGRGFTAKPDVGICTINGSSVGDELENDVMYLFDHGAGSSSTAYVAIFRKDGGNLAAGLVRVGLEFLDYA